MKYNIEKQAIIFKKISAILEKQTRIIEKKITV
ncbi:hypothetical protein PB1_15299 [Bacillus methanolicus PB1]|uniref:Uncharacterized protein n=1 Tax=Bacillus methanolicus PB1 TaxID=997296 RepID=I3DXG5_BACMT|nr:hypothetical protein PB1_15299 [Bacillus methanolicus PB1]